MHKDFRCRSPLWVKQLGRRSGATRCVGGATAVGISSSAGRCAWALPCHKPSRAPAVSCRVTWAWRWSWCWRWGRRGSPAPPAHCPAARHGSAPAPRAGSCISPQVPMGSRAVPPAASLSFTAVREVHRGFVGFIHKPLFVSVHSIFSLCRVRPLSSHAGEDM